MNEHLTRRNFVAGALVGVAVSLTVKGVAFGQAATKPASDGIDPSTLKDGFNMPSPNPKKIVLVKNGSTVYAMTAVCTHQGGTLRVAGEVLRCSKHGGNFDLEGKATKGPAKEQLCRYGISLKNGKIYVDANKIILPGDFEKDDAFVKIA